MTASDQMPAATDDPTLRVVFANQRRDFHRRPASPPTSRRASRRDSLRDIYGFDLSFPSMSLRFNFDFKCEIGLCLVSA